jgi:hypothetical protein
MNKVEEYRSGKIEAIRIKIVQAMERGEDISQLEAELKEARLAEATDKEVRELAEIASGRLQKKEITSALLARVTIQRDAIKALLDAKNQLAAPLRKLVEKAKVLPALEDACYVEFHDIIKAGCEVRMCDGSLPSDFTVPMLELGNGQRAAYDVVKEALYHLQCCNGLLAALHKIEVLPQVQKPDPYAENIS